MKRVMMLRSLAALIAGLLLSLGGPQRSLADPPNMPNLLGHYVGMYRSVVDPTRGVPISLDLTDQNGTVAVGRAISTNIVAELALIALPNFSKFQARTKQSEAKANAGSARNVELEFHGSIVNLGNGSHGLAASYTIGPPDNPTDQGSLISVQCIGGQDWSQIPSPDITGCWMGPYVLNHLANGAMTATFSSEMGSSLTAHMLLAINFDFTGTIAADGSILGIAQGPVPNLSYVQVTAQFYPATALSLAHIDGTFHYVFLDGGTTDATFTLFPCSLEEF